MSTIVEAPQQQMERLARIQSPQELLEAVAVFRLPQLADEQLQRLMNRNNEGELTPDEAEILAGLAEVGTAISLLRAHALRLLGRKP